MLPNAGMMKEKAVITVVALLKMKMKVMMVAMTVMMVAMQVKVKLTVMISMNQLRSLAQLIPVTKMIPAAMTMMISMNELTSLAQIFRWWPNDFGLGCNTSWPGPGLWEQWGWVHGEVCWRSCGWKRSWSSIHWQREPITMGSDWTVTKKQNSEEENGVGRKGLATVTNDLRCGHGFWIWWWWCAECASFQWRGYWKWPEPARFGRAADASNTFKWWFKWRWWWWWEGEPRLHHSSEASYYHAAMELNEEHEDERGQGEEGTQFV